MNKQHHSEEGEAIGDGVATASDKEEEVGGESKSEVEGKIDKKEEEEEVKGKEEASEKLDEIMGIG